MSRQGAESATNGLSKDFTRLDDAVASVLAQVKDLNERVVADERRIKELQELLKDVSSGKKTPADLLDRLKRAEVENKQLHERIERARDGVDRILKRIRFLEEQSS